MRSSLLPWARVVIMLAILGFLGVAIAVYELLIGKQYPQSKILTIDWPEHWSVSSCENMALPSYIDIEYRSTDASNMIRDWYKERFNNFPQNVDFPQFANIHGFLSQELYLPPNRIDQNEKSPTGFIITTSFQFCADY